MKSLFQLIAAQKLPQILLMWIVCITSARASTLHVLLLCDTEDDRIGQYAAVDHLHMMSLFKGNVRERDLRLVDLAGNKFTSDKALAELRRITSVLQPDDAVVIYFSGHGGYAQGGGHGLLIRNRTVYRRTILQELEKRRCRLKVIITDACFQESVLPPSKAAAYVEHPPETSPLFRRLFFESRGLLDMNSCVKTQVALCNEADHGKGSLFTSVLNDALSENAHSYDYNWDNLLDDLITKTPQRFREYIGQFENQRSQDPVLFSNFLAGVSDGRNEPVNHTRLGLLIEEFNGQMIVRGRDEFGVGSNLREQGKTANWVLDPGDVIRELNGIEVTSQQQFASILESSGRELQLRVQSGNREFDFVGNLR
jgi:hypothetical protein